LFIHKTMCCVRRSFLCSLISQGKVVALDRWGWKWNHLSMTHGHTNNCAKNYCNRTLIVKVIVENVVTFFGDTVYVVYLLSYAYCWWLLMCVVEWHELVKPQGGSKTFWHTDVHIWLLLLIVAWNVLVNLQSETKNLFILSGGVCSEYVFTATVKHYLV